MSTKPPSHKCAHTHTASETDLSQKTFFEELREQSLGRRTMKKFRRKRGNKKKKHLIFQDNSIEYLTSVKIMSVVEEGKDLLCMVAQLVARSVPRLAVHLL